MTVLKATHTTQYLYRAPVSICHTEVHLAPRPHHSQRLIDHDLDIYPRPEFLLTRQDYYGNPVTCFSIYEPHQTLIIRSSSFVEVECPQPPAAAMTPGWEDVRAEAEAARSDAAFDAAQFLFESPKIATGPDFSAYAGPSFPPARPVLEGLLDLTRRIHSDFRYDQRATTVTTPVDEVLRKRQGVCQDFAHFMIACLRSLRLPARYVSGYLRSGEHAVGAEASHAWVSAYCANAGWLEFDPTNNVMPSGRHVVAAWGRDYSDVTPVKGVALGGGEQVINVRVEVVPATRT